MCCQFSNGVSIPILCPLALPNKAVGLESQIGSWLASYLKPTSLLAQLHEPRASNHHRCMKPSKQCPQLASSRSRSTRQAHSLGAIEVGLDASQTDSPDRGAGGGVFLDTPSHRILANGDTTGTWSVAIFGAERTLVPGGKLGEWSVGSVRKVETPQKAASERLHLFLGPLRRQIGLNSKQRVNLIR
jgi:hypothetical protein